MASSLEGQHAALVLQVQLVSGKAKVQGYAQEINGIHVSRFEMELPSVQLPGDFSQGTRMLRHHRGVVTQCDFRIPASVIQERFAILVRSLKQFEHLTLSFDVQQCSVSGLYVVENNRVPFVACFQILATSPVDIAVVCSEVNMYGYTQKPAFDIGYQLLKAVGQLCSKSDVRLSSIHFSPISLLLSWCLPNGGWKIPHFSGLMLRSIKIDESGCSFVYDQSEMGSEEQKNTNLHALHRLEQARLLTQVESDLMSERYGEAFVQLNRLVLQDETTLLAQERLLQLNVLGHEYAQAARDVAIRILKHHPENRQALLVKAQLAETEYDWPTAAQCYHALKNLAVMRQEENNIEAACLQESKCLEHYHLKEAAQILESIDKPTSFKHDILFALFSIFVKLENYKQASYYGEKYLEYFNHESYSQYVYLNLAEIYISHLKNTKRARSLLEKVIQKDPNHFEAIALLAEIYVVKQEYATACSFLSRLAELSEINKDMQRYMQYQIRLGEIWYVHLKDASSARFRFQRVLDLNPRHFVANYFIGKIAVQEKNTDQIKKYFDAIINHEEASEKEYSEYVAEAYFSLGQMLASGQDKNVLQSVSYLKKCLEFNKKHNQAQKLLISLFRETHAWENLFLFLEKLEHETDDIQDKKSILMEAARTAWFDLKDAKKTEFYLNYVFNIDPCDAQAIQLATVLYEYIQKSEPLIEILKKASVVETDFRQIAHYLWQYFQLLSEDNKAEKTRVLRRISTVASHDIHALRLLVAYLDEHQDARELVAVLDTISKLTSSSEECAHVLCERARILLYVLHEDEYAQKVAEESCRLNPKIFLPWKIRSDALLNLKQHHDAIKVMHQCQPYFDGMSDNTGDYWKYARSVFEKTRHINEELFAIRQAVLYTQEEDALYERIVALGVQNDTKQEIDQILNYLIENPRSKNFQKAQALYAKSQIALSEQKFEEFVEYSKTVMHDYAAASIANKAKLNLFDYANRYKKQELIDFVAQSYESVQDTPRNIAYFRANLAFEQQHWLEALNYYEHAAMSESSNDVSVLSYEEKSVCFERSIFIANDLFPARSVALRAAWVQSHTGVTVHHIFFTLTDYLKEKMMWRPLANLYQEKINHAAPSVAVSFLEEAAHVAFHYLRDTSLGCDYFIQYALFDPEEKERVDKTWMILERYALPQVQASFAATIGSLLPHLGESLHWLEKAADIYDAQVQDKSAAMSVAQAILVKPGILYQHTQQCALFLAKYHRVDDAVFLLETSLKKNFQHDDGRLNHLLNILLNEYQTPSRAAIWCEDALMQVPECSEAWFTLMDLLNMAASRTIALDSIERLSKMIVFSPERIQDILQKAEKYVQEGAVSIAQSLADCVQNQQKSNVLALFVQADIYEQQLNSERAIQVLKNIEQTAEKKAIAEKALKRIIHLSQQEERFYPDAIEALCKIKKTKEEQKLLAKLALFVQNVPAFEEAALELSALSYQELDSAAHMFAQYGDWKKCSEYALQAIYSCDDMQWRIQAWDGILYQLYQEKQNDLRLFLLEQGIASSIGPEQAYLQAYKTATIYPWLFEGSYYPHEAGMYIHPEHVRTFEMFVKKIEAQSYSVLWLLLHATRALGQEQKALEYAQRLYHVYPHKDVRYTHILKLGAFLFYQCHDYGKSIEWLQHEFAVLDPESSWVLESSLEKLNRNDELLNILKHKIENQNQEIHLGLMLKGIRLAIHQGQYTLAENWIEQTQPHAGHSFEFYQLAYELYLKIEDTSKQISACDALIRLSQSDVDKAIWLRIQAKAMFDIEPQDKRIEYNMIEANWLDYHECKHVSHQQEMMLMQYGYLGNQKALCLSSFAAFHESILEQYLVSGIPDYNERLSIYEQAKLNQDHHLCLKLIDSFSHANVTYQTIALEDCLRNQDRERSLYMLHKKMASVHLNESEKLDSLDQIIKLSEEVYPYGVVAEYALEYALLKRSFAAFESAWNYSMKGQDLFIQMQIAFHWLPFIKEHEPLKINIAKQALQCAVLTKEESYQEIFLEYLAFLKQANAEDTAYFGKKYQNENPEKSCLLFEIAAHKSENEAKKKYYVSAIHTAFAYDSAKAMTLIYDAFLLFSNDSEIAFFAMHHLEKNVWSKHIQHWIYENVDAAWQDSTRRDLRIEAAIQCVDTGQEEQAVVFLKQAQECSQTLHSLDTIENLIKQINQKQFLAQFYVYASSLKVWSQDVIREKLLLAAELYQSFSDSIGELAVLRILTKYFPNDVGIQEKLVQAVRRIEKGKKEEIHIEKEKPILVIDSQEILEKPIQIEHSLSHVPVSVEEKEQNKHIDSHIDLVKHITQTPFLTKQVEKNLLEQKMDDALLCASLILCSEPQRYDMRVLFEDRVFEKPRYRLPQFLLPYSEHLVRFRYIDDLFDQYVRSFEKFVTNEDLPDDAEEVKAHPWNDIFDVCGIEPMPVFLSDNVREGATVFIRNEPCMLIDRYAVSHLSAQSVVFFIAMAAELYRTGHSLCAKMASADLSAMLASFCWVANTHITPPGSRAESEQWAQILRKKMKKNAILRSQAAARSYHLEFRQQDIAQWKQFYMEGAAKVALNMIGFVHDASEALCYRKTKAIKTEHTLSPEELELMRYSVSESFAKTRQCVLKGYDNLSMSITRK